MNKDKATIIDHRGSLPLKSNDQNSTPGPLVNKNSAH